MFALCSLLHVTLPAEFQCYTGPVYVECIERMVWSSMLTMNFQLNCIKRYERAPSWIKVNNINNTLPFKGINISGNEALTSNPLLKRPSDEKDWNRRALSWEVKEN